MHPYAPIPYTNTLMNTLSYPYTYTHYRPTGLILEYLLLEWKFHYYLMWALVLQPDSPIGLISVHYYLIGALV